ncbi:uncharacterized protein BJ212DRAFT_1309914, partial [Suillus subaureus]
MLLNLHKYYLCPPETKMCDPWEKCVPPRKKLCRPEKNVSPQNYIMSPPKTKHDSDNLCMFFLS